METENPISFELCRPVEEHARLAMVWRNDAATLAASYHREPKAWETFWPEFRDAYFGDGLPGPVFALEGGRRVGFLRFRPAPHPQGLRGRTVDLSINLDPARRGRGLGARVVAAALAHLREHGVASVVAEARAGNEASLRLFAAAGFADLGAAEKRIADTGEVCAIRRFVAELLPSFWYRRPVYVIAEAGSNWRMGTAARDLAMARALIDAAAEAGADAVKFQTYRPETVYVPNAGKSDYLAGAGIEEEIGAIFADLAMPYEMLGELAAYCRERKVDFLSTGFSPADFAAIDPLVSLHKIASYEISHPHLLELAARSGKPLILSTGASVEEDIAWAVETYRAAGGRDLCLMQCTASYPAPLDSLNLRTLPWLQNRFAAASGLSDHSREPSLAPVVAVALGARAIEKHFTLDNRLPGPDHAFALLPDELKQLVADVRRAESALGDGVKRIADAEQELAAFARRGLQATRAIAAGEALREGDNFAVLRPGKRSAGVHPRHRAALEGRRAARAIGLGEGLRADDGL